MVDHDLPGLKDAPACKLIVLPLTNEQHANRPSPAFVLSLEAFTSNKSSYSASAEPLICITKCLSLLSGL
jgi:hypothetical protein